MTERKGDESGEGLAVGAKRQNFSSIPAEFGSGFRWSGRDGAERMQMI
jgi:hypothetical protein